MSDIDVSVPTNVIDVELTNQLPVVVSIAENDVQVSITQPTIVVGVPPQAVDIAVPIHDVQVAVTQPNVAVAVVGDKGQKGDQGDKGNPGPPGPPGVSPTYTHNQAMIASSWVVEHNLGKHPEVTVEDSVGNIIHGGIQYVDDNQLVIRFSFGITGRANCS